ncbi:uncharacterized protein RCO7_11377 [Rhynchosporium graminicola]|uniref:DUF6606 domain-containing protein n=1 Tax=Rhynchosporium graminicola TaxID=2792576 RepID=A0A1E1LMU7_9HELO|nr:uncharacterized protein RCO7_11377 [Rhynchosporium commune]
MSPCSDLEYIITHVFLPPKLPQKDDSNPDRDLALTEILKAALDSFQAQLPARERPRWLRRYNSTILVVASKSGDCDIVPRLLNYINIEYTILSNLLPSSKAKDTELNQRFRSSDNRFGEI